jgi:hypothetical protein
MGYGAQFLQSVHRMMVCDATSSELQPIRRTQILVWALLALNYFYLYSSEGKMGFMTEWKLLVLINVISWGAIVHQIFYTL